MNAPNDNIARKVLPPRSGPRRLIRPVAYRHLRGFGAGHLAAGLVQATAGAICLAYDVNGWAAFFLAIAALNLAAGYWYLTIDRSAAALP
jgi:hypothetical protein